MPFLVDDPMSPALLKSESTYWHGDGCLFLLRPPNLPQPSVTRAVVGVFVNFASDKISRDSSHHLPARPPNVPTLFRRRHIYQPSCSLPICPQDLPLP